MIVFNVTPINTKYAYGELETFERNVEKAARLGATHIHVTEIPKSRWIWERDRSDPYPNWGMLNASLFKIIVPKELEEFLPLDYASQNLDFIREKVRILRRHGLKGAGQFCEPFYFPEEVFRIHPEWRGPRCDHPRRARNPYYSPCMDHPEVLSMYRYAMEQLCRECDLDYLFLFTNDSGSGICWSTGLYNGPNGPTWCRNIPIGKRILKFFQVFRQGAADAGRDLWIETNSNIGFKENESTMDLVWSGLEDNMAVNHRTNQNLPLSSNVDMNYEYNFAPVQRIPLVYRFLEQLEKAWHAPSKVIRVSTMEDDFDLYFRVYEKYMKDPGRGLHHRVKILLDLGKEIAGESGADFLVGAWEQTETALKHFLDTCIEGFSWTSVNQRLINRPFVLFPDELRPEERDYYRDFQFQANTEAHANDLLDNQNTSFIRGYYAGFVARKIIEKTIARVEEAGSLYLTAAEVSGTKESRDTLRLGKDRYALLKAFLLNYVHAIRFQNLVDSTDYSDGPLISARWPSEADERMKEYDQITRAEIDNTYEMIRLILGREHQMLVLADTEKEEDIFLLSPRIVEQLEKKAGIMLDRQLDGKRLYESYNK